jgi:hypothetical protein
VEDIAGTPHALPCQRATRPRAWDMQQQHLQQAQPSLPAAPVAPKRKRMAVAA